MVHHDFQFLLFGQLNQFFGLRTGVGEGFLDENTLPLFQDFFGKLKVRKYRGRDADGVDIGILDQFVAVCGDLHAGISLPYFLEGLLVHIADHVHLGVFGTVEVSHQVRTPVAVSDNAHSYHRTLL